MAARWLTALLVTHDALLLAIRVVVLSERPARIKAEIVNDCLIRGIAVIRAFWNDMKCWLISGLMRLGDGREAPRIDVTMRALGIPGLDGFGSDH